MKQPTFFTERLILRPFQLTDASQVQLLAGDSAVAATTLSIPHPYEDGMAEEWINTHEDGFNKKTNFTFAIILKENNSLIGAISLGNNTTHSRAAIGYWIGVPYWNKGYCSEAGKVMVKYGFEELKLNKIHAHHFKDNIASGKVMKNIGMHFEGTCKKHIKKSNTFIDIDLYGLCRHDYLKRQISVPTSEKSSKFNIYFSGSIRGGRKDAAIYYDIIEHLKLYGFIYTAFIGDVTLPETDEEGVSDDTIYNRDFNWVKEADYLIAEVTQPSLGVGYEIALANRFGTPVLALFHPSPGKRLSAMIGGDPNVTAKEYENIDSARKIINEYFLQIK